MLGFNKITEYFDSFVMTILRSKYGDILPKMSIMILGSVGLGNDDELSDLEVGIYLGDSDWKQFGREIQLSLNELLRNNNPWQEKGSVLCVHPTSWLLDGQAHKFLEDKYNLPWEDVSFETLFTVQNNLIVFDPQKMLEKLRDKSAPTNRPDMLWRKSLLVAFKNIIEELHELEDSVLRNETAEVFGSFGRIIEEIFCIGFIASRSYYPWRSHLSWAFEKLPLASDFKHLINRALAADTWPKKLEYIKNVTDAYKEYIKANDLLPGIDISAPSLEDELLWAERCKAWENPNWRDYITTCTKKAVDTGYIEKDFWVFSLWG